MIVYFADRYFNIIGMASTELPGGLTITDDLKTEEIETGMVSLELTIPFDNETRANVEESVAVGNYILKKGGDGDEFYTIIESETDTLKGDVTIYAEDAGLDLINEVVGAYTADDAYSIEYYIYKFADGSGFEIGINEVSPFTIRKLSWDGEATATERIASVATQFGGCEIAYRFEIEGLVVKKKYIDIFRERGHDIGVQLRLNKEVDSIVTKKSIANLATALQCTGGTPNTSNAVPITLKGYSYDDGDFYVDSKGILRSREAVQKWGRLLGNSMSHIVRQYSYDTTSQSTLCSHARTELKKIREMEINLEVEINNWRDDLSIGDRVNIIDDAGELYLSARLLKLETSEVNQEKKATLGEYLLKSSGISQKVIDLASDFSKMAASVQTNLATTVTSSREQFYQSASPTKLTGGSWSDTQPTWTDGTYVWRRTVVTYGNNYVEYTPDVNGVCITGNTGESGKDATLLRIESSRGTVFKNSAVSTVLSVVIYHGGQRITDACTMRDVFGTGAYLEWKWQKINEESFGVILSDDNRIKEDGFTFVLSPDDVDAKVTFLCELIV